MRKISLLIKQGRKQILSEEKQKIDVKGYWSEVLTLTCSLLAIWFAVSYGAGILFRDALDNLSIGGAPLGFWFAQSGSIFVFVILIVVYCRRMTKLEEKYGVEG